VLKLNSKLSFENFKYCVYPVKLLDITLFEEHAEIIAFYDRSWSQFFDKKSEKEGRDNLYALKDLYSEDLIGVLYYKDKIYAIHTCSIYNLDCALSNSTDYIKRYPTETLTEMKRLNIRTCLSAGNLYRDSFLSTNIAELQEIDIATIFLYFGGQLVLDYGVDGMISTARYSFGVASKLKNIGFQLFEDIEVFGDKCCTGAAKASQVRIPSEHPNNVFARTLWKNHTNYHLVSYEQLKNVG